MLRQVQQEFYEYRNPHSHDLRVSLYFLVVFRFDRSVHIYIRVRHQGNKNFSVLYYFPRQVEKCNCSTDDRPTSVLFKDDLDYISH
jgi:hypothetical protein